MPTVVSRIVELFVFRFSGDRPEYLLLRRADGEPLYPGMWQCITGRIEEGEKAWQAARRELREETGLEPGRVWVVPHVSAFYDPVHDALHLSPVFATQVAPAAVPVLSPEHQSLAWLPYREAAARLVWPGQRKGLEIVHHELAGGGEAGRRTQLPFPFVED
jgi:dATP pyrophosphohydrolase